MSTAATPTSSSRSDDHQALGHSMERVLGQPLAALRASIEALAAELEAGDPRGRTLAAALSQVTRMTRDLQSLVEYTAPRPLAPLRCTFEEIARGVVAMLPEEHGKRLELAYPGRGDALVVDGPLLVTCLASLAQGALESAPGNVLLRARHEDEHTTFTLVRADAGVVYEPEEAALDRAESDASLAVRLTVARRDIARMGGDLCVQHTARGTTCVSVRLPDAREEAAG